jgi:hypothetical protein
MSTNLIDPTLLFRFEIPLQHDRCEWSARGLNLPDACRVPCLDQLSDRPGFADIRLAWNRLGLGVQVRVGGKRQLPWCRDSRLDDSDGFHLWIDTRCSPGIHRATQFCHRFLWMPVGGGSRREQPLAALIPIHRARSHPRSVAAGQLHVAASPRHDGYELSGFVPAAALTGYDPGQQSRIGIYYAVMDRELGWQGLALGPEYPVTDDPSLWAEGVLKVT